MSKTVALVQLKGGTGRSTIATNLAGELAKRAKTALIDADLPQGTSQSWAATRIKEGKAGELTATTAADHKELIKKSEALAKEHAYVVIDCPPRIAEITRAALLLSDLVIVPVSASLATLWATTDVQDLLSEAEKVRPVTARSLWNFYRANTLLAEELGKEARSLGIKPLKSRLGLRVAFADAYGRGLTACEVQNSAAKQEVAALVSEVVSLLKKT